MVAALRFHFTIADFKVTCHVVIGNLLVVMVAKQTRIAFLLTRLHYYKFAHVMFQTTGSRPSSFCIDIAIEGDNTQTKAQSHAYTVYMAIAWAGFRFCEVSCSKQPVAKFINMVSCESRLWPQSVTMVQQSWNAD